ncbi:MAG: 50S ribosomal protein L23 [Candidatus Bathyarchaeia archaeon]
MEAQEIILYPLMSEVASRVIEKENKLVFIVNRKATKYDIKRAVEELYQVKVKDVNVMNTVKGNKKAFVKLEPEYNATDVAIKIGIL